MSYKHYALRYSRGEGWCQQEVTLAMAGAGVEGGGGRERVSFYRWRDNNSPTAQLIIQHNAVLSR